MKAIRSLVAVSGLLIGSAAIGYAQQGGAPQGGTTAGSGSAAQFGSSPGSAAPLGSSPTAPFGSSPREQLPPNGSAPGEPTVSGNTGNTGNDRNGQPVVGGSGAWITGPGNGGGVVERHDHTISRENDVTTGRADRGGCTTQVYRVPSEATGDTTSINVVRC
jgi:hypothetical protein